MECTVGDHNPYAIVVHSVDFAIDGDRGAKQSEGAAEMCTLCIKYRWRVGGEREIRWKLQHFKGKEIAGKAAPGLQLL